MGLAIAFAGICFAFLGEPEPRLASNPLLGNTLATLTAMIFGARMVFTQRLVQRIEPLRAIFWQIPARYLLANLSVVSQATQQEELRPTRELDACDTTI